jgi:predicted nucleic acid-binding protein
MSVWPTISKSSCLIALHAAGYLDLLQQLYTVIEEPEPVNLEFGLLCGEFFLD